MGKGISPIIHVIGLIPFFRPLQIDQPYLDALSNGLSYLINRMQGQPIFAHITLEKGERSALADLASELL